MNPGLNLTKSVPGYAPWDKPQISPLSQPHSSLWNNGRKLAWPWDGSLILFRAKPPALQVPVRPGAFLPGLALVGQCYSWMGRARMHDLPSLARPEVLPSRHSGPTLLSVSLRLGFSSVHRRLCLYFQQLCFCSAEICKYFQQDVLSRDISHIPSLSNF